MEGCKIAEGDVIETKFRTSTSNALRIKTVTTVRLKLIRKYQHYALFENLDGNAPNNYICFDYLETEKLRRGQLIAELY